MFCFESAKPGRIHKILLTATVRLTVELLHAKVISKQNCFGLKFAKTITENTVFLRHDYFWHNLELIWSSVQIVGFFA